MSNFIKVSHGKGVTVITLTQQSPAVLSAQARAALFHALNSAFEDISTEAVVLSAEAGAWRYDLPINERIEGQSDPTLAQLCAQISNAPKPVVAAMRGRVYQAGFELALSAQARITHANAQIRLGHLQAARLPAPEALLTLASKLVPQALMPFLESREFFPVGHPALEPLWNDAVMQNVVGRAAEYAQELANNGVPPSETPGAQDPLSYQDAIQQARAASPNIPERTTLIDVLEAAQLLTPQAFTEFASEHSCALAKTPHAAAKTYEAASKEALLSTEAQAQPAQRISIVGKGSLARNLVLAVVRAGLQAELVTLESGMSQSLHTQLSEMMNVLIARNQMTRQQAQAAQDNITVRDTLDALAEAEFVIEAAVTSVEEIPKLAKTLRANMPSKAPLLLTAAMRHGAGRFAHLLDDTTAGAYFQFAPNAQNFAELLVKPDMATTAASTPFLPTLQRIGLPCVAETAQDGIASSRILTAYLAGAEECAARGATVAEIEAALTERLPPFRFQNAEGLHLQPFRISTFIKPDDDTTTVPPALNSYWLKAGFNRRSQSSLFSEDSRALLPEARDTLETWQNDIQARYRPNADTARTKPTAQAITDIVDAAVFCAAAQLLESGTVQSASALDFLSCAVLEAKTAYGGALYQAQTKGLLKMERFLRNFEPLRPELFQPPAGLNEMIRNGARFQLPQDQ